jgi:hypothetical protein
VEHIGTICGEAVATGKPEIMGSVKRKLARLIWRLERSGHIDLALHGALRSSVQTLSAAQNSLDMATSASRGLTLQSKILDSLVEGPKRPVVMARELGVHQTQISRALRALHDRGLVSRISTPRWESDFKARWYDLAVDANANRSSVQADVCLL